MALTCSGCSAQVPDDAKFCPVCGSRQEPGAKPAPVAAAAAPAKPATASLAAATTEPAQATVIDGPRVLAGRFMTERNGADSPVGMIHAATDLQHGGAAIRMLLVGDGVLPSAALVDRTLREWKQLGKVTSPRVLRVVDQGKLDDGKVYVATDPPKGESLATLVGREGPLSIERLKKLVSQIGEALSEAQKVGVIHRDVSPRNIFVSNDEVTVADFGVAEALTDKVFGSAAYLSPEQAEGKPVDQRSNIYSLGAVIYFMLTGHAPFEGDTPSLLSQHSSATPQAPSVRRPGLPVELDRIVAKALEKSGGRRHLTLRQLVTEVEAVAAAAVSVRSEELGRASTLQGQEQVKAAPLPPSGTVLGMPPVTQSRPQVAADKTAETPALPDVPVAKQKAQLAEAPVLPAKPIDKPKTVETKAQPAKADPAKTDPAKTDPAKTDPAKTDPGKTDPGSPPAPPETAEIAKPADPKPMPSAVAAASAAAAAKKGGGFRETAWFKKGEIEEEMAKAAAEHATADPLAPTGTTGQHISIDESDLKVSSGDAQRLSLKTGATQMMPAFKTGSGSQALPGDRMDESEMLAEIDRSRRWFTIAGIIVALVVIGGVVLLMTHKSDDAPKPPAKTSAAPTTPAAPTAAAPTTPAAPTAAAPTAPAPAAPTSPTTPAPSGAAALLTESSDALAKSNWIVAVDALLRASRADGVDATRVKTLAASLDKALAQAAASAKKKKDRVGESEARALAQKLRPLLPAAPAKKPGRSTARRR